jgi:hypothetical protein
MWGPFPLAPPPVFASDRTQSQQDAPFPTIAPHRRLAHGRVSNGR